MSKSYETGNAKNAANFETLISSVKGYGTAYKPTKTAITLGNLQAHGQQAKNAIATVHNLLPAYSNAVALREIAFEPLGKLSTKIISSIKATDTPQQIIDNAVTNHRKLQGRRASHKLTDAEKQALAAEGKVVNQVSASQQSYDNLLDTFYKQIQLLASIPQYIPNETEIKVATLTTMYNDLKAKNSVVINQTTPLDNARMVRNQILYNKETGLVAVALDAKMYVKSVFGPSSPEYKQISKLEFKYVAG